MSENEAQRNDQEPSTGQVPQEGADASAGDTYSDGHSPSKEQRSGDNHWGDPWRRDEPAYTPEQHAAHQQPHHPGGHWQGGPVSGGNDPWASPAGWTNASPDRPRKPRGMGLVALALVAGILGGAGGGYLAASGNNGSATFHTVTTDVTKAAERAPGSYGEVADQVLPSVVNIDVSSATSAGTGTGIVLSKEGYILTNNHVIAGAGAAGRIVVTFNDGSTALGKVVGADSTYDLAVVRVAADDKLVPATLGSSSGVQVGDAVLALGSPLGLSGTVTSGIVSALNRPVNTTSQPQQQQDPFSGQSPQASASTVIDAIQTDAAINPGNSGGPLVNIQGQVVGVNSAIATVGASNGGEAGSIGLGFSIPIDLAKRVAQEIITSGKASHPLLGVSVGTDQSQNGSTAVEVQEVTTGGAAEKAGIKQGDVIEEVAGRKVFTADALVAAVRSQQPGSTITVKVRSGSNERDVQVALAESE